MLRTRGKRRWRHDPITIPRDPLVRRIGPRTAGTIAAAFFHPDDLPLDEVPRYNVLRSSLRKRSRIVRA